MLEAYAWISEFLDPVTLGSWASIIALMAGLYSVVKIRNIRNNIKDDRDFLQRIARLPEVHFNLQQIKGYLAETLTSGSSDRNKALALFEGVKAPETCLEMFFEFNYDVNVSGSNALVRVASFYRSVGNIDRAATYYKKALSSAGYRKESGQGSSTGIYRKSLQYHAEHSLKYEDLRECCRGLQFCYLATWQLREAIDIGQWSQEESLGCIPAETVKRRFLIVCTSATLRLAAVASISMVRRVRLRIRTLRTL